MRAPFAAAALSLLAAACQNVQTERQDLNARPDSAVPVGTEVVVSTPRSDITCTKLASGTMAERVDADRGALVFSRDMNTGAFMAINSRGATRVDSNIGLFGENPPTASVVDEKGSLGPARTQAVIAEMRDLAAICIDAVNGSVTNRAIIRSTRMLTPHESGEANRAAHSIVVMAVILTAPEGERPATPSRGRIRAPQRNP